jgi:hypothetical protein
MNASLIENRLVVGDMDEYESQNLEVTPEEQEAMKVIEAQQKKKAIDNEVAKLARANPALLRGQVIEAISDAGNAFPLYLHQAINSNDECTIGRLIMNALRDYRSALAMEEVGRPSLLREQAS